MVQLVFVRVCLDELVTAAQRLACVQSDLGAANTAASASTTQVAVAARDEISEGIAALFSSYAQQFHAAVEQTGTVGVGRFAHGLTSAAHSYASAEWSNAQSLSQAQTSALLTQVLTDVLLVLALPFFPIFVVGALAVALLIAAALFISANFPPPG